MHQCYIKLLQEHAPVTANRNSLFYIILGPAPGTSSMIEFVWNYVLLAINKCIVSVCPLPHNYNMDCVWQFMFPMHCIYLAFPVIIIPHNIDTQPR